MIWTFVIALFLCFIENALATTIDCGGARTELSFEKSQTYKDAVVSVISVSRGGKFTILRFDGGIDFVGLECKNDKTGRPIVVFQAYCGGSGCRDLDNYGIINPADLQVLLVPSDTNSQQAKAILGMEPAPVEQMESISKVKERLSQTESGGSALAGNLKGPTPVTPQSQASAATLHLRGGQKVKGDFIGASNTEIQFKVGLQTLKFKVDEITAVVFDPSSILPSASVHDSFSKAAKDVLRPLKALAAVVEAGVTYRDYTPRVSDAKIKVNEFMDEYKDGPNPDFNLHVKDALGYYIAVSTAWNAKITDSYETVFFDPYIMKCKPWAEEMKKNGWDKDSKGVPRSRRIGVSTSLNGIPYLWGCANEELAQAEDALKK